MSRSSSTVGRCEAAAGERDRPLAPRRAAGIDQPARDERRAGAAVDDGRHQPVVLVAEVRRQPGPLAERAGGRRAPAAPGTPRAAVTTSVHARRRRPATPTRRRRARTRAPGRRTPRRGDHHDHTMPARAVDLGAHRARRRATPRIDCGSTSPMRPPPGRAGGRRGRGTRRRRRRTARRRGGWRRRGSSPPPAATGTAGCRRRRRRAGAGPVVAERVGAATRDVLAGQRGGRRADGCAGSMSTPTSTGPPAERARSAAPAAARKRPSPHAGSTTTTSAPGARRR